VELPGGVYFETNATWLPCTMQQWEDLTNEMTTNINKLVKPHFLSADYVAQVLMQTIHAYDHKHGMVLKSEMFESCVNRISCHATFHAVQDIQRKLQEEAAKNQTDPSLKVVSDEDEEVL
jgi:hypothetical protein